MSCFLAEMTPEITAGGSSSARVQLGEWAAVFAPWLVLGWRVALLVNQQDTLGGGSGERFGRAHRWRGTARVRAS